MSSLDDIAPHFARSVANWPNAALLRKHYQSLSLTLDGSQNGVIELTKSFLECVCTTILKDFGSSDTGTTTVQMVTFAARAVGLHHQRGAGKLDKILSAYFKLTEAINDLRNDSGNVAHGKDGFLEPLLANQVRILVLVADSILALLLGALHRTEPDIRHTRRPFGSFEHLHAKIDGAVRCGATVSDALDFDPSDPVQTVTVEFLVPGLDDPVSLILRPSEILYQLDRDAYIEVLNSCAPPSPTKPKR